MDNRMFFITFPNVAYALQYYEQSCNNNNRPNKKNDVITDLGGEGDFPMFLLPSPLAPQPPRTPDTPESPCACTARPRALVRLSHQPDYSA
ncbi:MAG: hypothetical protein CM15mP74_34970 [Halieaceae bacterium]|nr:MAG: hypothetical protein CM15mP74_34970 [Halieaceae bacterium]